MALKALIVDDDFINRKLLHTFLKRNPSITAITEAENGSDALDKLKEDPDINLILLDIVMPIIDGIEFLKIFRSESKNSHIPIIVLSTDDTKKRGVLEKGANDFLTKPVKESALSEKIAKWT